MTAEFDDDGEGGLWCVVCGVRTPGAPEAIDPELKGRKRKAALANLVDLCRNWRCGRCLDEAEAEIDAQAEPG